MTRMTVAIIGAGMAGLACADALVESGHAVRLFDKGRGPGGRMATRRLATPLGEAGFDLGAQYFTARDPAFVRLVKTWSDRGLAAPWPSAGSDAWVGVPGMNAVVRHMATHHAVTWDCRVTGASRSKGRWWLAGGTGPIGPFDAVVLAIPAEQAASMLALHDLALARTALMARSQPCWTGMFAFAEPIDTLPPIIRDAGAIAWTTRNSAKPGRTGPESWLVQASAEWSRERLEETPEQVTTQLLAALADVQGRPLPVPVASAAHRWRYALSAGTGDGALWHPGLRLGVCGDWLLGPRVECAWLSGRMLAAAATSIVPQSRAPVGFMTAVGAGAPHMSQRSYFHGDHPL